MPTSGCLEHVLHHTGACDRTVTLAGGGGTHCHCWQRRMREEEQDRESAVGEMTELANRLRKMSAGISGPRPLLSAVRKHRQF